MTDGKKEENGRLDFMERIRREAEEERLKSIAEEEAKKSTIVEEEKEPIAVQEEKRPSHNMDENKFDYYYSADEDDDSNKRMLIGIFGVGIIGLMGYFGFNYFQDDKTPTQNSVIVASDKAKETNSTGLDKSKLIASVESKKEEVKSKEEQSSSKIEPSVTPNSEVADKEKAMVATIIQSINQNKESKKDVSKVDAPIKLAENRIEKETPAKNVEKKEIVKREEPKEVAKKIVKEKVATKKIKKKIVKKRVVAKKEVEKRLKPRVITIKRGDTLASISKKYYGNPMEFNRIVRANRSIRRASSPLHLGQKIIVPRLSKEKSKKSTTVKKRRFVIVKKGDTLAIIAKRFYGDSTKFQRIIDANYKIKSASSRLHIGQKIYVPR